MLLPEWKNAFGMSSLFDNDRVNAILEALGIDKMQSTDRCCKQEEMREAICPKKGFG